MKTRQKKTSINLYRINTTVRKWRDEILKYNDNETLEHRGEPKQSNS